MGTPDQLRMAADQLYHRQSSGTCRRGGCKNRLPDRLENSDTETPFTTAEAQRDMDRDPYSKYFDQSTVHAWHHRMECNYREYQRFCGLSHESDYVQRNCQVAPGAG